MSTQLLEGLSPAAQLLMQLAVRHGVAPIQFAQVPPLDESAAALAVAEVKERGLLRTTSESEGLLMLTPIGLALEEAVRSGWPQLHALLRPRLIEHVGQLYDLGADSPVLAAMRAVDRARFLPDGSLPLADLDVPAPIAVGETTTSAPSAIAAILGSVMPAPGERVLVCGTKAGMTMALSAHMVGPGGAVLGIDDHEQLAAYAGLRSESVGAASAPIQVSMVPDVTLGVVEEPAFDVVIMNGSVPKVPQDLLAQLTLGGRMLLFLQEALVDGQSCYVVSRDGRIRKDELMSRFVFTPIYGRWGWDRIEQTQPTSQSSDCDEQNS